MGIFDFLKKKKEAPSYDVTNLKLADLDHGFIVDYNMKSWQVKEVYEYDWGSNNFSQEYMLDAGDEVVYLHIENKGELWITVSKSVNIRELGEDIIDKTIKKERPPKKLEYKGTVYHLDSDNAGYFNDKTKGTDDWEELMSWEYYDDSEELVLGITQWGERDFDASAGKVVKEYEFSDIIPASA